MILGIKKPLHKPLRGIVPSPLVPFPVSFYFFSPSLFCLPLPLLSQSLPTGAGPDGHIGVNLEHWVPGVVLVKHSQGIHFFWDATGFRNARDDSDGSDYALDGRVVGRPHHLKGTEGKTGEGLHKEMRCCGVVGGGGDAALTLGMGNPQVPAQ